MLQCDRASDRDNRGVSGMKWLFLAMFVLIGLPMTVNAWCGGDTNYTMAQFNVTFRDRDIVYINLTANNITCKYANCTDVKVFDQNDVELVYLNTSDTGKKAYQVLLDNITDRDHPQNDFLIMQPQNSSGFYYLCYNHTVNNTFGYLQMWADNFERYAVGDTPIRSLSASGACTIKQNGNDKICGTNSAWFQRWRLPTNYTNVTFQFEMNNTATATNTHDIRIFQLTTGFSSGYRAPYSSNTNQIDLRNDTVNAEFGTPMTYTATGKAVNWTSGRQGNEVFAYYNHGYYTNRTSGNDTTAMSRDSIIVGGGIASVWGIMSLKAWNVSVITYGVMANVTMELPHNYVIPITNTCTPITPLWSLNLADNCTITGTYSIGNILIYTTGLGSSRFFNLNLTYSNLTYGSFINWATLIKDRSSVLISK